MSQPTRRAGAWMQWFPELTVLLILAVGLIAYFGLRGGSAPTAAKQPSKPTPAEEELISQTPEPEAPMGPNRELFCYTCTSCHSTRRIFSQPRLPEKKWAEIVHRMVVDHEAPASPDEENQIVAYLTAIWGP